MAMRRFTLCQQTSQRCSTACHTLLLSRYGGDGETLIRHIMHHFAHTTCQYRLAAGFLSRKCNMTRGAQGCALSVFAANTVMAVAMQEATDSLPKEAARGGLYVDDLNFACIEEGYIPQIMKRMEATLGYLDMKFSQAKSYVWSTSDTVDARWRRAQAPLHLPVANQVKLLGVIVRIRGRSTAVVHKASTWVTKCKQRALRVASLPVARSLRCTLSASMIMPVIMYCPLGDWLDRNQERSVEASITKVCAGSTATQWEAKEMDYILYRPLHHHCPSASRVAKLVEMAQIAYQLDPVGTLMRMNSRVAATSRPTGIASSLLAALKWMGIALRENMLCSASHQDFLFCAWSGLSRKE